MFLISEHRNNSICDNIYKIDKDIIVNFKNNHAKSDNNDCSGHFDLLKIIFGLYANLKCIFHQVFVPAGYPRTVSKEYASHRRWELLQEFANCITVSLATERTLKAAGVGDAFATPLTAATIVLVKSAVGSIGIILVTWRSGGEFYIVSKKWRLAADILCDASIFLQMITSLVSMNILVYAMLSAILSSTSGLVGSASRVLVHRHHAVHNNLEDVLTKGTIQSEMVMIVAIACSYCILNLIEGRVILSWITYFLFTSLHLYSNYNGLKTLRFKILNNETVLICLKQFIHVGTVPTIQELNREESVLFGFGIRDVDVCGYRVRLGLSLDEALRVNDRHNFRIQETLEEFVDQPFIIFHDPAMRNLNVLLRKDVKHSEIIEAYTRAVIGIARHTKDVPDFISLEVTKLSNQFLNLVEENGIMTNETLIGTGSSRADWKRN